MHENFETSYTRSVIELSDILPVITSQAIFSRTGLKLVNNGVRLNPTFFERLAQHSIMPPLEECLVVENGVSNDELVARAQLLMQSEPPLARMVKLLPADADLLQPLRVVALSEPVVFMLTLARERRPHALTHSIMAALISIYLGIRLGMSQQRLVDLACAGLCHDLGELCLDQRLLDFKAHLTTQERQQLYGHPDISRRILQNSRIYSMETINAVMQHHERMDGSGYPHGLSGNEITRAAQILMIAEVAGSVLEQSACDGEARLEITLKLNAQRFGANLLGFMSVMYEDEKNGVVVSPHVRVEHIHNQLNHIRLAFNFWQRLLDNTPVQPRTAASYMQQHLTSLMVATLDAGINTSDKNLATAGMEQDEKGLAELDQLSKEALWQIKETIFEVQRRWPNYRSDVTSQGAVVKSWMDYMQELLLDVLERTPN